MQDRRGRSLLLPPAMTFGTGYEVMVGANSNHGVQTEMPTTSKLITMKNTGIIDLDSTMHQLVNRYNHLLNIEKSDYRAENFKDTAEMLIEDVNKFRLKLACDRKTEEIEYAFGWYLQFDEMIEKIEQIIKRFSNHGDIK